MPPTSIFEGTDEIVSNAFEFQPGDSLKHKSVSRRFNDLPANHPAFERLIPRLYARIEENWSGRTPSPENWRLELQTYVGERNTSPEVLLERAIAVLAGRGILNGWFNQIPVASGLIDEHADKRAAVDLVHVQGREANLVELKWESDTPVYAAFEILRYGLAFLFCYENRKRFGYSENGLLGCSAVKLSVLAPQPYFETYDLASFGRQLSAAAHRFVADRTRGRLSMTFRFDHLAAGFSIPVRSGADVAMLGSSMSHAGCGQSLKQALDGIGPVWACSPGERR